MAFTYNRIQEYILKSNLKEHIEHYSNTIDKEERGARLRAMQKLFFHWQDYGAKFYGNGSCRYEVDSERLHAMIAWLQQKNPVLAEKIVNI